MDAAQNRTEKTRIYLVDDHMLVRESLAHLINRHSDLSVCGDTDSFDRALHDILEMQPELAIIDIQLADKSGLELIKELKQKQSTTSFIVLSMHDEIYYAERCIRAGASAYLMKRESCSQIVKAIRQVLAVQMYVSEDVAALLNQRLSGAKQNTEASVNSLSDRELLVFSLLGKGMATRLVADELNINVRTVHTYCARIKQKLRLLSAKELLREAIYWHDQNEKSMSA